MREIGLSKEECIRKLQWYSDKIDEIVGLFGQGSRVPREDVPNARELLKELKDSLKSDYRSRDTKRGREQMSDVESAFFFPAVHEAWTSINVKTHYVPSTQWVEELSYAQVSINHNLGDLKSQGF